MWCVFYFFIILLCATLCLLRPWYMGIWMIVYVYNIGNNSNCLCKSRYLLTSRGLQCHGKIQPIDSTLVFTSAYHTMCNKSDLDLYKDRVVSYIWMAKWKFWDAKGPMKGRVHNKICIVVVGCYGMPFRHRVWNRLQYGGCSIWP